MKYFLKELLFLTILLFVYINGNECSYSAHLLRRIDNIGFHRNIYYVVSLKDNWIVENCKICIQETLPNGLFVNRDQLGDLLRLGKLIAAVDGIVDIESPADTSPPLNVQILLELNHKPEHFEANATLPVHTRYHSPQPGGGFKTVTLDKPELYIHCAEKLSYVKGEVFMTTCADHEKTPVPFYKVPFTVSEEDASLKVEVPVGDSDSFLLVQTATIFVTLVGSVYITGVVLKI